MPSLLPPGEGARRADEGGRSRSGGIWCSTSLHWRRRECPFADPHPNPSPRRRGARPLRRRRPSRPPPPRISPRSSRNSSRNACGGLLRLRSSMRVAHQLAQVLAVGGRILVEQLRQGRRRRRRSGARARLRRGAAPRSRGAAASPSSSSASRIASSDSSSSRRICLARNASWRLWAMCAVMRLRSRMCGSRSSGIGSLASCACGQRDQLFAQATAPPAPRAGSGCGWG